MDVVAVQQQQQKGIIDEKQRKIEELQRKYENYNEAAQGQLSVNV